MKVLDIKNDQDIMSVTIKIEPQEFTAAQKEAYLDNTDRFVVPGRAPGLAEPAEINAVYGPDALADEALARSVPFWFGTFLAKFNIRTVGRPEVLETARLADGGAVFRVRTTIYPKVKLGCYKGLHVAQRRGDNEEEFTMAVLKEACREMEGIAPDAMVEQKLDALAAQEKLNVSQDAVYHLLADVVCVLREAYSAAGVSRPLAQVRAEATDVMLQTVSENNKDQPHDFMAGQISSLVERYHKLPEDFDGVLKKIFAKRGAQKSKMTPAELADEAFTAYLGSIDMDEQKWRAERRQEAAESARCDLLLEAVAKAEGMSVTDVELAGRVSKIAAQCGMETDEVLAQIDPEPIRQQLLRDKACRFLLDSACGESDPS